MISEYWRQRFWKKVDVRGLDECWPWLGSKRREDGRGTMGRSQSEYGTTYPYRVSWILSYGEIPEGLLVCHHCDNPSCCNPRHLFVGTHLDNRRDLVSKNLQRKGEDIWNSVLTIEKVNQIRLLYSQRLVTQSELAIKFGVSASTIGKAIRGEKWKSAGAGDPKDHRIKITKSQSEEIRKRYALGGVTQRQLGREYGVTATLVHNILGAELIAIVPHPPIITNPQITHQIASEIRAIYAAGGMSQKSLAIRYDLDRSQINRIVNLKAWWPPILARL